MSKSKSIEYRGRFITPHGKKFKVFVGTYQTVANVKEAEAAIDRFLDLKNAADKVIAKIVRIPIAEAVPKFLAEKSANRAAFKEQVERGRLCETAKRDADEIERLSILKNCLYTQARNEVPTLLSKTSPQEMEEATKTLVDTALSSAQEEIRKRSEVAKDEDDPELVVPEPESDLEGLRSSRLHG